MSTLQGLMSQGFYLPRFSYLSILTVGIACCLFVASRAGAQAPEELLHKEYRIKSAFLSNFIKFTTFSNGIDRLSVCVLAEPLVVEIFNALDGKRVSGKSISLVALKNPAEVRNCNVIFVSNAKSEQAQDILDQVSEYQLSVGESPNFLSQGGLINFFVKENKVRFEVSSKALDRTSLAISSKLLQLASIVE